MFYFVQGSRQIKCHQLLFDLPGFTDANMGDERPKRWQEICRQVIDETDSDRLLALVQELCRELDGERRPPNKPARTEEDPGPNEGGDGEKAS